MQNRAFAADSYFQYTRCMPELPEVETIVNDLKPILNGAVFDEFVSEFPRILVVEEGLRERARGAKVESVERRGKFINIFLVGGLVITVHLRMTGRLIVKGASLSAAAKWNERRKGTEGGAKSEEPAIPYERARIEFDTCSLRFSDIRKFGRVWLNTSEEYEQKTGIYKLGPEPLESTFTFEKFLARVQNKRGSVKKILLDQTIVAGVGNIYADEGMFYAGIKPEQEISKLKKAELEKVFNGFIRALNQGVKNRGTSISDFADAFGHLGTNQEVINVYGRGGKPCYNCGENLQKTKLAGRGTVFCAKCQK